jgi:glycosyltransferase involved in cell wall biosynthesis
MVVSAVNFTEGGPLTILQQFIASACEVLPLEWRIVVFVHDRRLLAVGRAQFVEIPAAKTSWLFRMYVEWIAFRAHARRLRPDLWVSLHDMTPRVGPIRQAVYCHNPMPFYRLRLRDVWLDPRMLLFRFFYAIIYRINIRRNYAVVVQQSWLREEFRRWVGTDTRIIVSHPEVERPAIGSERVRSGHACGVTFLYPALPRVFKNIELVCRAVGLLEGNQHWRSQVALTIDGTENRYARWLCASFGELKTVRFVGRQSAQQMQALYSASDCLLFPSLIETWGLPISEAKRLGMPMMVADLPYAHETVGRYDQVDFIDVQDAPALAGKMLVFQNDRASHSRTQGVEPSPPFACGWRELLSLLVEGLD